jgi:hypothetical protein
MWEGSSRRSYKSSSYLVSTMPMISLTVKPVSLVKGPLAARPVMREEQGRHCSHVELILVISRQIPHEDRDQLTLCKDG